VSKSRGWLWPAAARKAHYFTDGRSLCGKFAAVGSEPTQADDRGAPWLTLPTWPRSSSSPP
jgi:hypothetical protein